jgi:chromosome segregation protein
VAAEIDDLRNKIHRLGNINLDAITEQEEHEQRLEYLTVQSRDLTDARSQLQNLIDKINQESTELFLKNFEAIHVNFSELFRKLFGGGRAEIILEDPDDVLECGIEIVARPPGKQLQSISLLSGGEKTMTAVALLLAIFKSKPSPFCLLDEVDAALDEANIERFCLLVQEFLKDSQFIIITHSRRTMSIADVIYGITMQEQGVSKKVSVRFDREEEPENAGTAVA